MMNKENLKNICVNLHCKDCPLSTTYYLCRYTSSYAQYTEIEKIPDRYYDFIRSKEKELNKIKEEIDEFKKELQYEGPNNSCDTK